MTALNLVAWLVPAVLLMAWGVLAVVLDRRSGSALTGAVLVLAGIVLAVAACVRYHVLPAEALVTLVLAVVLVSALVMVSVAMGSSRVPP